MDRGWKEAQNIFFVVLPWCGVPLCLFRYGSFAADSSYARETTQRKIA